MNNWLDSETNFAVTNPAMLKLISLDTVFVEVGTI